MTKIEKIEIHNFKVVKDALPIKLQGKNLLLFGENGSGKTSIYEALKLLFFHSRIFRERIPANVLGEGRAAAEKEILSEFSNHNDPRNVIDVILNDTNHFKTYTPTDIEPYLISYTDIFKHTDELDFKDLIDKAYFSVTSTMTDWYDTDFVKALIAKINNVLDKQFWIKDIKLNLSATNRLTLERDGLAPKYEHLRTYYNESILHLINVIALIETMTYLSSATKQRILVMDDCFNSLDMENRTFVIKYILKNTLGYQKIIMTHNIGFYDLFQYICNNSPDLQEKWISCQLYSIDGIVGIEPIGDLDFEKFANSLKTIIKLKDKGNAIRQRFEKDIYMISLLGNLGELQETQTLLNIIASGHNKVYLSNSKGQFKDVYDLIKEIMAIASLPKYSTNSFAIDIRKRINEFQQHDFLNEIRDDLIDTRVLQKVALHQSSHGHLGKTPTSSKEIDVALKLLGRIENTINLALKYKKSKLGSM